MSLEIKIEKIYTGIQDFTECYCKVKFRNTFQFITLKRKKPVNNSVKNITNELEVNERATFLEASEESIVFGLGTSLQRNEPLEIECFKFKSFRKK